MKTKIKISILVTAAFVSAVTIASAQSTAGDNTYGAAKFLGWGATSGDLPFKVNNSTKMTLKNTTGYLGLGTPNPLGMFQATAGNGAGSWAYFTGNVSGNNPNTSFFGGLAIGYNVRGTCETNFVSGPADCGTAGGFRFQNWVYSGGGTLTDLVTILGTSGNTGIGTSAPASKLDVEGGVSIGTSYSGATAAPSDGAIIEGNVGIGTSTPGAKLTVDGGFYLNRPSTMVDGGNTLSPNPSAANQTIKIVPQDLSSSNRGYVDLMFPDNFSFRIATDYDGNLGSAVYRDIQFGRYNAAPYMTVKDGGYVGIGNTAPSYKLDVTGDVRATGVMSVGTTPSGSYRLTINGDGLAVGGDFYPSDQFFKTEIDSLQNALATIKQLKPKTYYFDTTNVWGLNFSNKKQYGFLAQELEQVLPDIIKTSTKEADVDTLGNIVHPAVTFKAVNYTEFIAILTKGIQELQQKNDSLQTELNKQDSVNTSQQNQMNLIQNQLVANSTLFQDQLNQLLSTINDCCSRPQESSANNSQTKSMTTSESGTTQIDVELNNSQTIVLQQNHPNPYAEKTAINYYLPDNIGKAEILFYNTQGRLIKSVELINKGKGTLNVFAGDLSGGIYTYTLIVDGRIIETKKMVKQ